jgi:hypothetical protein
MSQASYKFDTTAQVRMTREEREALDDWRRRQRQIPTRPEAIRAAIRRLIAQEPARLGISDGNVMSA